MPSQTVLVVAPSPDRRDSTSELATLLTELRRRPGVEVHVWYLRRSEEEPWPGSRVVDDLRTSPLPAALDRVGLRPFAGLLRGRTLRRWWAELGPSVVILDDGLGERLLPADRPGPVVVHRINPVPSQDDGLEPAPVRRPDVQIVPEGTEPPAPAAAQVLVTRPLSDMEPTRPFVAAESRAIVRKRLGLPTEGLLVVGWGTNPWFDGPDVFVRAIWRLRERHGVDAHGLWAGADDEGEVASVIEDEVGRCGLEGHVTHVPRATIDVRLSGDVAFLPYRDGGDLAPVREASMTGCETVTFPVWDVTDPFLRTVPHLDLDAAATAIVDSAGGDRDARASAARETLDVASFVDELLAAVDRARRS